MRRQFIPLHLSTGAWVFLTAVTVAIITSPNIYAAATSVVAIGNEGNAQTAIVIRGTRQLQTAVTAPENMVHVSAGIPGPCKTVYTPPPGKAIIVTHVTYTYGSGVEGNESFGGLFGPGCSDIYDQIDSTRKYGTESHTFTSGMAMSGIAAVASGGQINIFVHGYLIPAANLPAAQTTHLGEQIKSMSVR